MTNKLPSNEQLKAAANLARQRVAAIHKNAPSASEEALDVEELSGEIKRSRHQEYMHQLTISGKSLPEIQAAWHEYYAGLPDAEKHQVWSEYYGTHQQAQTVIAGTHFATKETDQVKTNDLSSIHKHNSVKTQKTTPKKRLKPKQHFQSLLFGLAAGSVVLIIFLFSFFNERFIAPFIQPSRNVTNTPLIVSGDQVGKNPEVIVPKINVQIPVIYGAKTDEVSIQKALESGVVHYTNTALPGSNGNVAIVGHSSNNILNKGNYKFAFVLLSKMDIGDTFYLQKDGVRYTYEVYDKKIVKPSEVSVLGSQDKPATATLITCDPPGTSTNRLVVVGKQISPDPAGNQSSTVSDAPAPTTIPSNSPSLWSRITNIL